MKRFFVVSFLAIFTLAFTEVWAEDLWRSSQEVFSYKTTLKEPIVAAICSVVITGAGQAYNEQWKKGGILLGVNLLGLGMVIGSLEENDKGDLEIPDGNAGIATMGILTAVGSQVYSIIDAYRTANDINERKSKSSLFQYDGDRFTFGLNPITSRKRVGTIFSLRF